MDLKKIVDGIVQRSKHAAINRLMESGISEEEATLYFQDILSKLPNLNGELRKFYQGIARWVIEEQVKLGSNISVAKLNKLLYNLKGTPFVDLYDKDFNGQSIDDIAMTLELNLDAEDYVYSGNHTYEVWDITDFDELSQYQGKAGWCILDEEVFNSYTSSGITYKVIERDDFDKVPKQKGKDFPLDDYGLSLIMVGVEAGEIVSVTSRWNFDNRGDSFLSEKQLKDLLGDEFQFLKN
ncbi:MAG: hypothetical protein J1F29_02675 [Lentimicrobiaceae bacterium]|nr:hypothetical protein [Lentimicrobiaceae bacterium]